MNKVTANEKQCHSVRIGVRSGMERNIEASLQIIMEQLKEISAGQSEVKSDICAEVKSDMNKMKC